MEIIVLEDEWNILGRRMKRLRMNSGFWLELSLVSTPSDEVMVNVDIKIKKNVKVLIYESRLYLRQKKRGGVRCLG